MSVYNSMRELKACVEVCKEVDLSPGATEAAANIVTEEENPKTSLLTGDNIKEY